MDWHTRFTQQAKWTDELRRYLFAQSGLEQADRILEIGCGTGAVLARLPVTPGQVFGLDINRAYLTQAAGYAPGASLIQGDALDLPIANAQFDCIYFHFTLLWVADAGRALSEARRVLRSGGWLMALAEPDYGGRIDYPDELVEAGRLQAEALHRQGADTQMGRRLGALFNQADLRNIETGLLSGQWRQPPSQADLDEEWAVLEADLQGVLSTQELARLRQVDMEAWQSGRRVLFVPTFYAIGQAA
jgi:SAM-dependent methyltransferase